MGCFQFSRANNVAPATGPDNGTELKVGSYDAGTHLFLRCRYAENYINATTAPAARQWEGPYLRIYPALPSIDERAMMGKRIGKSTDVLAFQGGNVSPLGNDRPYYEVDAINQGAIFLPFACEVTMYSDLSGAWVFDVFSYEDNEGWSTRKELSARGYAQTRKIAAGQADRTLTVPLGCREYSFSGNLSAPPAGLPILWSEETGKVAGLGTSIWLATGITGPGPLDRMSIQGARKIVLQDDAANALAITFWCYF